MSELWTVKKPKELGPWDRFKESWQDAADRGFGGWVVRRVHDAFDIGKKPGQSEQAHDRIRVEDVKVRRARRAEKLAESDRTFANVDTLSPANIGKWAVDLTANLIGGADPTYAIGGPIGQGVKQVLKRVGVQAGLNAGMDAGFQASEKVEGIRQDGVDRIRDF